MDINTIFNTIYSSPMTAGQFFTMAGFSLVFGFLYSVLISLRIRSTKRFFTVTALIPFVVASVITFVNGNIGAGVAIGGAFSLIRFSLGSGKRGRNRLNLYRDGRWYSLRYGIYSLRNIDSRMPVAAVYSTIGTARV